MAWSSILSFFSGYIGKALMLGCVFLAFFVMKLRLDTAQAELEKSRLEISVLQNGNEKQRQAIKTLLEAQQRQNEALSEYERKKQDSETQVIQAKEKLQKIGDNESINWKKQKLPENIRQILTGK